MLSTSRNATAESHDLTGRKILKSVFGYDSFISLQEDVIQSVIGGRGCLAVMLTD
jgi:superfamily II DNA helicase RecQ